MKISRRRLLGLVAAIAAIGTVKPAPVQALEIGKGTAAMAAEASTGLARLSERGAESVIPASWFYESITAAEAFERTLNASGRSEGDRAALLYPIGPMGGDARWHNEPLWDV